MANIYQDFGKKVRHLRKTQKITQETLADAIGRDVRTVVAIENGTRNTTLKTLHKIARALKVPPSELLTK